MEWKIERTGTGLASLRGSPLTKLLLECLPFPLWTPLFTFFFFVWLLFIKIGFVDRRFLGRRSSFSRSSFSRHPSKIIGYVDITLTMRSAHCICFYGFKQDQLRSTIFNSITNYIFSLRKATYSVVFAFVCHHFWKIYKKLNSETLTFSSH